MLRIPPKLGLCKGPKLHSLEKQYVVKIKKFSMDISANPRAWRGAHLPVYVLQAKEILFQFSVLGERGGKISRGDK